MFGLKAIDGAVLAAYFVVVAAIGFWASRLIKNREDFFMGGRRFGKILTIFFSFGAGTHADDAVTVSSKSYRVGLAGIWYQWMMLFTLPIYWLLAPVFRRARVLSTADFLERRYGSQFMILYAVFSLFICVSYTSVMLYGSARLLEALTAGGITWQVGILTTASLSFLYAVIGGLVAAVWNDLFQGLLTILMSVLLIPFFWARVGGLEGFRAALPNREQAFQLVLSTDMTVFWIAMMSINSLFSMVAQPHIMANAGATKTEMDSRVGFVGGMILKRLITIPWALTGVMATALFGAGTINPDHAFGKIARELLPAGGVGLMLACVMASVMDNCAVLMVSFSSIYTNNLHKRVFGRRNKETETSQLAVGRLAGLAFALVSVAVAFVFTDMPGARRFLWKTVPLMGIPFLLGLVWRPANRYGAFASFFVACAAMLTGEYFFQWTGDAGLPYTVALFLAAGIGSGVIVSLLTPGEPKRALDAFFLLLRTPIGEEHKLREAGMVEMPGTQTFELPPEESDRTHAAQRPPRSRSWEIARPGRQALLGFAAISVLMLFLLGGLKLLALWLSGNAA